ncbi:PREDICTED: transmembrane protein C1orf162 homolog [Dipodomys ordii]|uniref:Transmembrane protein C1orf162 homolog n=1 Tax=Dipodomys ordii TaxID=10020 RepID=A0A1S3FU07_DIPOR|nr:PREDICTED: transmembrane protein C1orf162 homolog [Dipodomys ordii]
MGGSHPKPKIDTITVPPTSPEPCHLNLPKKEHLILAFFAGVLLTLLLLAFVFLIVKSCRRCHSNSQTLDSGSDPPAKLSTIQKDSPTYASMTFRPSEEKNNHLIENSSTDLDPIVYAQVKVTNSQLLPP